MLIKDYLLDLFVWPCVQIDLDHELEQWPDQILVEIKVVVRHLCRHDQGSLALAFSLELGCMIVWDQRIFLSMNDESWAHDMLHQFEIFKAFCDNSA